MLELAPKLLNTLNRTLRESFPSLQRHPEIPVRDRGEFPLLPAHLLDRPERVQQLEASIEMAQSHILQLQNSEGFWEGRVYDNVTITSEYLMFLRFLGILEDETRKKTQTYILENQNEDGSWSVYGGGPANHSATIEAYFALKLCGLSKNHEAFKKALPIIRKEGGIESSRVFTKINLAMFGEYPWSKVPTINPELILIPRQAPIHIYEFSSWSRAVIIPLLIIFDQKPVVSLDAKEKVTELHVNQDPQGKWQKIRQIRNQKWDLEQIFEVAQKALRFYEKMPLKPLRPKALQMAEDWILEHQDGEGNWGGIFPAIANSILALHLRGYPLSDERIQKGLKTLRSFTEESETSLRVQSTVSPGWDTGITVYAFEESGFSADDPRIRKAISWLLDLQILKAKGDWKFKAPHTRPGGWPFEHENDHYPDIDDTALAILALLPMERFPDIKDRLTRSIDRGIEWIVGMQGTDGGWGAFDRDNNRQILNQIPFADLKSLLDPSTPDVTAHALEALASAGVRLENQVMKRAVSFIKDSQTPDGSWFGRWGVNYIYGTGAVLSAVAIAGEDGKQKYVQEGLRFLLRTQNTDGGWGESCASYDVDHYVPLGNSTPSQTAWALLGLLAVPGKHQDAIYRGLDFLIKNQNIDGGWTEKEWTGTGFPKHFYLRYDLYRLYFPLLALGRALKGHRKSARSTEAAEA